MKNKIFIFSTMRETLPVWLRIVILLIFVSLIGSLSKGNILQAQDIIFLKSGDEIKSSVIEIGTDIIKYRKFENLTGPVYNLEKSKISMIKYENGTKDVFNNLPEKQQEVISKPEADVSAFASHEPLTTTGIKIYQSKEKLSPSEVRRLLAPNPEALHSYNSGRVLNGFDWAITIAGLGVYVAVYAIDGRFWPAFGALSPFMIADMILYSVARKKINASVSLYNFSVRQVSYKVNFGIQENGIGFAMRF